MNVKSGFKDAASGGHSRCRMTIRCWEASRCGEHPGGIGFQVWNGWKRARWLWDARLPCG